MQTLARLFGRSPFAPLQAHMDKVAECVKMMVPLFEALDKRDYQLIAVTADRISHLEHEADLARNDIRNHLSTSLFLPIDRTSILEVLTLQDTFANQVKDIGILLTLQPLVILPEMVPSFWPLVHKNREAFEAAHAIIKEMGGLLESSFGGLEAERVQKMVESVGIKEHEADLLQRALLQAIFGLPEAMDAPTLFLWMRVIQELAHISDESEHLANRIRMMLEVK